MAEAPSSALVLALDILFTRGVDNALGLGRPTSVRAALAEMVERYRDQVAETNRWIRLGENKAKVRIVMRVRRSVCVGQK